MPTSETRAHLAALYAGSDDPWNTRSSSYEQRKFAQTLSSLPRTRYRCCLEVGCGAGALTGLLAPCCDVLIAMDCTPTALDAARAYTDLKNVHYLEGAVPGDWTCATPDLVILSEVLYFLTADENAGLAQRLARDCTEDCHVILVNWLGDTGGLIDGAAAADRLIRLLAPTHHMVGTRYFPKFRIDILGRDGQSSNWAV